MQPGGEKPAPWNPGVIGIIPPPHGEVGLRSKPGGGLFAEGSITPPGSAFSRATLPIKGRDEGGSARSLGRNEEGAGGAGKARIRRGGEGQRHGNLLEHANTGTQALDKAFDRRPACFFNARGAKLTDAFAAWNVVTHGHKTPISFLFCSYSESNPESRRRGQT
jgi:hypothetical protein